jgi:ATP-dependent DNA ligase
MHLLSTNLKDLSLSFPELVCAGDALPPGTLVDGEIVIADARGRGHARRHRLPGLQIARRGAADPSLTSGEGCVL